MFVKNEMIPDLMWFKEGAKIECELDPYRGFLYQMNRPYS